MARTDLQPWLRQSYNHGYNRARSYKFDHLKVHVAITPCLNQSSLSLLELLQHLTFHHLTILTTWSFIICTCTWCGPGILPEEGVNTCMSRHSCHSNQYWTTTNFSLKCTWLSIQILPLNTQSSTQWYIMRSTLRYCSQDVYSQDVYSCTQCHEVPSLPMCFLRWGPGNNLRGYSHTYL